VAIGAMFAGMAMAVPGCSVYGALTRGPASGSTTAPAVDDDEQRIRDVVTRMGRALDDF
jgi:hypothetical protein